MPIIRCASGLTSIYRRQNVSLSFPSSYFNLSILPKESQGSNFGRSTGNRTQIERLKVAYSTIEL